MARTVFRVSPAGAGRWEVSSGSNRQTFQRKDEAIQYGRRMARAAEPSQLVVQRSSGQIEEEFTYGDDPEETKG
jgi:hypothetical protein